MFLINRTPYADFESLVDALPDNTFAAPTRSTIPLLDYWRVPEPRLTDLTEQLELDRRGKPSLSFEYQVAVRNGQGKPSCTDLMIRGDDYAVAIEAKFTEPGDQKVRDWLAGGAGENRRSVFAGWLSYIAEAGCSIEEPALENAPYQLVHRLASVCSIEVPRRVVVYQTFSSGGAFYPIDFSPFANAHGANGGVTFKLMQCPMKVTRDFEELHEAWRKGDRAGLATRVRASLKKGPLFEFEDVNLI